MLHALVYHGSFELNYDRLAFGTRTYLATDGAERPVAETPAAIDGIVIGYMERAGKKFVAVRLRFEERDIALRNPVPLNPLRHMGGRRFSAKPITLPDDVASVLLDDVIAQNRDQETSLALLLTRVNQVRRGDRGSIE